MIGILDKYKDELIINTPLVYKLIYNIYMESTLDVRFRNGSIDKLFISYVLKNNQDFFYNYIALFINYLIKNHTTSNSYNSIFSKFEIFITYYYDLAYNKDYGFEYQQNIIERIIDYINNKLKNNKHNNGLINNNVKLELNKLSPEIKEKLKNSLIKFKDNKLNDIFKSIKNRKNNNN